MVALGAVGIYRFKFGAAREPVAAAGDAVDDEQARERARNFLASTPLHLRAVRANEMTSALATMSLPRTERPLAWMSIWDTDAQDGDEVRVESAGFSIVVPLTSTPYTFAIPIPQKGTVDIIGVRDGGGGITAGAMSGARHIALPRMIVGQVLSVPVIVK